MGIAVTTLTATTRQLSDGNSVGTQLGTGIGDKISFYAATPLTQQTSTAQAGVLASSASAAMSTASGAVTVWGWTSAATPNGLVTLVNELRADLVALGLIKGS